MKKRLMVLAMMGAGLAGLLVGCATSKNVSDDDGKEQAEQPEDTEQSEETEASEEADEMAKQDEDAAGNRNNVEADDDVVVEGESVDEIETFVTYYGCPNSKRVAALNTKKNRLWL